MSILALTLVFAQFGGHGAKAEQTVLTTDPTLPIPKVELGTKC